MTQPSPTDHIYRCVAGHGTNRVHHHSRSVGSDIPWTTTGDTRLLQGALGSTPRDGYERYAAPDGTQYRFSRADYTTELTDPSQIPAQETAMTSTFAVGDIVIADRGRGRPSGHPASAPLLVVNTDQRDWITTMIGVSGDNGWGLPNVRVPEIIAETWPRSQFWNISAENLRLATEEDERPPVWMVAARALIRPEPTVRPVSIDYPPVVGEVLEVTRRRPAGAQLEVGEKVVVIHVNNGSVDCERTPHRNGTWAVPFAALRRTAASQPVTPTNLHPLTRRHLDDFGAFVITSRPVGTMTSDTVQFGCQSWPMSALQEAGATLTFTPTGVQVTVRIPNERESRRGLYHLQVGDRFLEIGSINEFAERIVGEPKPAGVDRSAVDTSLTALVHQFGATLTEADDGAMARLTHAVADFIDARRGAAS